MRGPRPGPEEINILVQVPVLDKENQVPIYNFTLRENMILVVAIGK